MTSTAHRFVSLRVFDMIEGHAIRRDKTLA